MKKLLIYNDDIWELGQRNTAPLSVKDIEKHSVNKVSGTGIDIYQIGLLTGNVAITHRSKILEPFCCQVPKPYKMYMWRMKKTVESLAEQNTDMLEIISRRCREVGIEPHATMRVNDPHHTLKPPQKVSGNIDAQGIVRSEMGKLKFLNEYSFPDLRSPWIESTKGTWLPQGTFDFAYEEVRERKKQVLFEILDNYDIDGIDLDFTRIRPFFQDGEKEKNMHLMTGWIEDIRRYLDKKSQERHRNLKLTARFEYDPEVNYSEGLDVETYVKKGLLDILMLGVIGDATPDASAKWFIDRCKGTGCKVCPGIEGHFYWIGTDIGTGRPVTLDTASAAASAYYCEGADGLQLYNFVATDQPLDKRIMEDIAYPDRIEFQNKKYVFTMWSGANMAKRNVWESKFYMMNDQNESECSIYIGDDIEKNRRLGIDFCGDLMIRIDGVNLKEDLDIRMNGISLTYAEGADCTFVWDSFCVYTFHLHVPPQAMKQGENTVSLHRMITYPDYEGHIEVQELELEMIYNKTVYTSNLQGGSSCIPYSSQTTRYISDRD